MQRISGNDGRKFRGFLQNKCWNFFAKVIVCKNGEGRSNVPRARPLISPVLTGHIHSWLLTNGPTHKCRAILTHARHVRE